MRFTFVLINTFVIICAVALCALTPAGAVADHDAGKSVCDLPKEIGPCRKADPVYYHNAATKQCEEFLYGGCLGNDNRFHTKDECERTCSVAKASPPDVAATATVVAAAAATSAPVAAADH